MKTPRWSNSSTRVRDMRDRSEVLAQVITNATNADASARAWPHHGPATRRSTQWSPHHSFFPEARQSAYYVTRGASSRCRTPCCARIRHPSRT